MKKYIPYILGVIAAIVRFYQLGLSQYWYDESFTVSISKLDLSSLISATASDTHPPFYYLITWGIAHLFGTNEIIMRFPSLIAGLVSIYLAWLIAKKLGANEKVQLALVVLMIFIPLEIHFSQEARMYTIFQALVLWLLLETINRNWVRVGVAALLVLYTHNYGLFFVPVVMVVGFLLEIKRPVRAVTKDDYLPPGFDLPIQERGEECQIKKCFLAFVIPSLLFIPWLLVIFHQMSIVSQGYWIQPASEGGIVYVLYMLFWSFSLPGGWQPIAIIVTVGLLLYSLTRKPRFIYVWLAFAPIVLAVGLSILWKPILLFRGLVPCAPFLYLLILEGVFKIQGKYKKYLVGAFALPILIVGFINYYPSNIANKGNTISPITYIKANWKEGDIIYHINDATLLTYSVYGSELPQYEMIPCARVDLGALSNQTRLSMGVVPVDLSSIAFKRAWVIYYDGPTSTQCEEQKAKQYTQQKVITFRDDSLVMDGIFIYDNQR